MSSLKNLAYGAKVRAELQKLHLSGDVACMKAGAPDSYKSCVVVHICKFQHLGSEGKSIRTSGSPWATFKASLSYMKPCLKTHCLDSYLQTGNIEFHLQFGVKFTVNSGLLKLHCNTCACLNVWEQRHCLHNM